jgi:hypothetical protein
MVDSNVMARCRILCRGEIAWEIRDAITIRKGARSFLANVRKTEDFKTVD